MATKGEFTEKTALGMLGYALFLGAQLACLYSPALTTQSASSPALFCLLRGFALACTALTFFVFSRFIKHRDRLVQASGPKIIATAAQLLLVALVASETFFGVTVPAVVVFIAWGIWGSAQAALTCSWVDAKSNVGEAYNTKITFWSFVLAACLLVGVLAFNQDAALIGVAASLIAACVLLLAAPGHRELSPVEPDEEWLRSRNSFNARGSFSMAVDGVLIGFAAAASLEGIIQHDISLAFMGGAFLLTAILFAALRKLNPELLSISRSQLVLLPVIAGCLALMGFLHAPAFCYVGLILFSVSYFFDLVNRSTLSLRGSLLSISPTYSYASGRLYIIGGQAIGWILVAFVLSSWGAVFGPFEPVLLLIVLCIHIAMGSKPDEVLADRQAAEVAAAQEIEESTVPLHSQSGAVNPETTSFALKSRFKNRCTRTAQEFDLTQREAEILSYLARGRNAKYIADQLFVAERTVKTHMYHIYQKMEIHSQQELIDIVDKTDED